MGNLVMFGWKTDNPFIDGGVMYLRKAGSISPGYKALYPRGWNIEDGSDMFLRMVSRLSTDYTTVYARR
jgi:hypothetical protein